MPVACYVRENKLTTPPSCCCQTTAEETLGYDEIAEFIHLLNPSITAAQAETVLLPVTPENAHAWVLPYDYTAEAQCKENAITTNLKEL